MFHWVFSTDKIRNGYLNYCKLFLWKWKIKAREVISLKYVDTRGEKIIQTRTNTAHFLQLMLRWSWANDLPSLHCNTSKDTCIVEAPRYLLKSWCFGLVGHTLGGIWSLVFKIPLTKPCRLNYSEILLCLEAHVGK